MHSQTFRYKLTEKGKELDSWIGKRIEATEKLKEFNYKLIDENDRLEFRNAIVELIRSCQKVEDITRYWGGNSDE